MIQEIYASRADKNTTFEDVQKILDISHKNNKKHSISGMLIFNGDYFLQAIEGEEISVNRLLENISKDARHNDIYHLGKIKIKNRDFSDWSMGYVNSRESILQTTIKITGSADFNPLKYDFEEAKKLLKEFSLLI